MNSYTTTSALRTVVEVLRKPWQLFVYHPVKFEIDGVFPTTKTSLHSRTINGTTYYMAHMQNQLKRDQQVFVHDGKFRSDDFLQAFDEFARKFGLTAPGNLPATIAESCYTAPLTKYFTANNVAFDLASRQMNFFAMNQGQMLYHRNFAFNTLPSGFSFDELNASKEAEVVHNSHPYGDEFGLEFIKEKLRRFPSLCVRKGKELAGFVALDPHGALSNLLVFDKYRGENIGRQLESGAARLAIEAGIIPSKFIETNNEFYLEKSRNIKQGRIMDVVAHNDKPIVVDYNIFNPAVVLNVNT